MPLKPLRHNTRNLMEPPGRDMISYLDDDKHAAYTPRMPGKTTFAATSTGPAAAAAAPTGKSVDHALEMFRNRQAMGGAGVYGQNYVFDGEVAELGAGDDKPVTDKEIERAHDVIREHVLTRFGTMARCFRMVDEDHSGFIDRIEALRCVATV